MSELENFKFFQVPTLNFELTASWPALHAKKDQPDMEIFSSCNCIHKKNVINGYNTVETSSHKKSNHAPHSALQRATFPEA